MIPDGPGLETPAGAEALSIRVGALRIEGGLPALDPYTADLAAGLSGRTVTVAEIFAAARGLERVYAEAGYALVRVVLPAQQLTDGGDVRLVVVDGMIERIDTSALPDGIRDPIAAILALLAGRKGLRLGEIERALMLAADMPGTVLRSTLALGAEPGTSLLVIEARHKPVTGLLSLDNTLSSSLGTYTMGLGVELNSLAGLGETVYLRASGAPYTGGSASIFGDAPRNRSLATGLVLPIGIDGLSLNLEGTRSRTTTRIGAGNLEFASKFSRQSIRLRYPVVRSRAFTLNAEAAFDALEERLVATVPVDAPISRDRLRVARPSGDVFWHVPGGWPLSFRLAGSFGIDGLGARRPPPVGSNDAPMSRQGAGPGFEKLEAGLGYTVTLAENLTADLRGRAQYAFNQALPSAEQIGLSGGAGLSSFDSGTLQGDDGYVVRGEIQAPFVRSVTLPVIVPSFSAQQGFTPAGPADAGVLVLSPYVFGAFGLVHQQQPTAVERAFVCGTAYGIGLRIAAAPQASFTNLSAGIEFGVGRRSDLSGNDHRLTFSLALQL